MQKILVIDDDKEIQEFLCDIIEEMGVKAVGVSNGSKALEKILYEKFDVYVVDYTMPIIDGEKFIQRLKLQQPDSIAIMLTGNDDPNTIIKIMKLGVFDYILKPIKLKSLEEVIEKALEYRKNQLLQKRMQIEASREIQAKIQWNTFKENKLDGKRQFNEELLHALRTNLLQGAGISTSISLIELLKDLQKENEADMLIKKDLLDLLISNNEVCKNQLNSLTNSFSIISKTAIALVPVSPVKIYEWIHEITTRLAAPVLEKMDSTFSIGQIQKHHTLAIHEESFKLLLEELLINASKYTMKQETIAFYSYIQDSYMIFSVKNAIERENLGVPEKYEKLVLEPFFRLTKISEDMFYSYKEKFLIGLGLTVVNHIVKLHNGLFWIKNGLDHTNANTRHCVFAEVAIPIPNQDLL